MKLKSYEHLTTARCALCRARGRDAQRRPRRLEAKPLAEVTGWLERYREYWEQSYLQLDALLASTT